MRQLRTLRTTPIAPSDTRDRGDHWTTRAACANPKGIDAHAWAIDAPKSAHAETEAKAFCKRCDFKERCLQEYDLLVPEGVIGGLNADERNLWRRGNIPAPVYRTCTANGCDNTWQHTQRNGARRFCQDSCQKTTERERRRVGAA